MQEREFADLVPGAAVTAFEFDRDISEDQEEELASLQESPRSPVSFLRDVEVSLDKLRSQRPEPIVL